MFFRRIVRLKALLIVCCILLAGCAISPVEQGGEGQDMSTPNVAGGPDGKTKIPEGGGEASETDGAGTAQEDKKPRHEVGEKKLHLDMYSKIKYIGGDKLLVYGKKEILLLDMYTLEVLKRANNEAYGDKFTISEIFQREDGICMICGELQEELHHGGKSLQAVIDYDSELQPVKVLNLKETLCSDYKGLIWHYEFIDGGRKLLYSLTQNQKSCFYIYDFQNGEITEIMPQSDVFVGSFLYLESVNQILLERLYGNNQRELVRMDMNGKILETNSEHRYGKMWDFQDFVLINESVPVGGKGEGAFFYYDIQNSSVRSFPFADKGDSDVQATTSSGGKYFVACQQPPDKEIPYKLHIYSSEDGSLICEMQLSSEEFGEGFILNGIYINDETERMILYGSWAGRSYETWIVSKDLIE